MLTSKDYKHIPLPTSVAMSQGYIGYHLQNALENEFTRRGMDKDVCTVVTQVLVDETNVRRSKELVVKQGADV